MQLRPDKEQRALQLMEMVMLDTQTAVAMLKNKTTVLSFKDASVLAEFLEAAHKNAEKLAALLAR